ncbi:MAG: hypothetical protein IKZ08_02630 [Bacteroidales bacterium]|nr:hypothetical protein [Bacteroidales bacterium]
MNNILFKSKMFLKHNSSTILTCIAGVGVVATTVMAVRATPKALASIEEAKEEKGDDLTTLETIVAAAPAYIPTVLVGVSTIACIFSANALNKRQQAALTSAYALLDNSYKEFKAKVTEMYGENAVVEVKKEIAKDHIEEADIYASDDKQWFYDDFSGRTFESTMENVLNAELQINRLLAQDNGVFLNEFYELLGIPPVDYGNHVGWSSIALYDMYWWSWIEFKHEKVVLDDGLECTMIIMEYDPMYDFENY